MARRPYVLLLLLVTALVLAACGGAPAATPAAPAAGSAKTPAPAAPAKAAAPAPATAPAPAKAAAPDKVAIQMAWLPLGSHGPFFLATEKGWYKEANLEVTVVDGTGSVGTVQQVGGGQHTFGYANLPVVALGKGQGMPLRAVAGLLQRNVIGVFVGKDTGIKTPKDLEGRSILASSGSFATPLIPGFLKKTGVDINKVKVSNVAAAAQVTDYIAKKADGIVTDVPFAIPSVEKTRPSDVLYWDKYGVALPGYGLFTREEVLQKNPDMVRRFVQVSLRAWEYTMSNMDEAVAALLKHRPGKIEGPLAKRQLELYKDFVHSERTKGKAWGLMSEEDWKESLELLRDYNDHKGSTNPADYYTNQYVGK